MSNNLYNMLDLYHLFILLSLGFVSLSLFISASSSKNKKDNVKHKKTKNKLTEKLETINEASIDDLIEKKANKEKETAYQAKLAIIRKRLQPKVSSSSQEEDSSG